jgi:stearoyl-CoA 9-desaturase NADPH oxidoreductase
MIPGTTIAQDFITFLNESLFNSPSFRNYLEPVLESWKLPRSFLFSNAKVEEIVAERDDVLSIVLSPDKKWKGFIPGQYVQIGLEINGVYYRRIFSISSSLELFQKHRKIRLSIQKQHLGKVTNHLFDTIKKGDFLKLGEAMGQFTLESCENTNILMVAGGVGITPILSMLSSVQDDSKNITLLYYAQNLRPHLFSSALEDIKANHPNIAIHLLNSDIDGFFAVEHLEKYCPNYSERSLYLCGPAAMAAHVRKVWEALGGKKDIHSEAFTAQRIFSFDADKKKQVNVKLSKSQQEFNELNDSTLLELLEKKGVNPTFGCRMGICNQCSCKKVSGVVFNQTDNSLSGTGEEYIKICSSIPVEDVEIEL